MRGKAKDAINAVSAVRITPAYAGKRRPQLILCNFTGDHPRVCGEKGGGQPQTQSDAGSPPRMRGKVTQRLHFAMLLRITPAYAGKSRAPSAQQ